MSHSPVRSFDRSTALPVSPVLFSVIASSIAIVFFVSTFGIFLCKRRVPTSHTPCKKTLATRCTRLTHLRTGAQSYLPLHRPRYSFITSNSIYTSPARRLDQDLSLDQPFLTQRLSPPVFAIHRLVPGVPQAPLRTLPTRAVCRALPSTRRRSIGVSAWDQYLGQAPNPCSAGRARSDETAPGDSSLPGRSQSASPRPSEALMLGDRILNSRGFSASRRVQADTPHGNKWETMENAHRAVGNSAKREVREDPECFCRFRPSQILQG